MLLQRWGGLTDCNNVVYWGSEEGTITVLLFVFQPTVKKQTVARTGFPGSCLSNVCCPALLCVCTCERNTPARCISCPFVFCSNLIQANLPGNSVPETGGLAPPQGLCPVEGCCVALQCLFRARKRPSSSFSVQQWQAGPARQQLCPWGDGGVSQPWGQGLACAFGCAVLVRLSCFYFTCVTWRHSLFLSPTGGETGFCL